MTTPTFPTVMGTVASSRGCELGLLNRCSTSSHLCPEAGPSPLLGPTDRATPRASPAPSSLQLSPTPQGPLGHYPCGSLPCRAFPGPRQDPQRPRSFPAHPRGPLGVSPGPQQSLGCGLGLRAKPGSGGAGGGGNCVDGGGARAPVGPGAERIRRERGLAARREPPAGSRATA